MNYTIHTTKVAAFETIAAEFPEAPAEITLAIHDLVRRINSHRGDVKIYDDFLDIWVIATA